MLVAVCILLVGLLCAEATRNPIVQIARTTAGQIHLSWNVVPDATCYSIYQAATPLPPSDPGWQFLANTTGTSYAFYSNLRREFYCIRSIDTPFIPVNLVFMERASGSFYIGKYETTQAEYYSVMGTNPSHFIGNPCRPVECIQFFNMIEYCNRRSMMEGLSPCYSYDTYGTDPGNWPAGWTANSAGISANLSVNGYRLPWVSEWEYAAHDGYSPPYPYEYSGSNNIFAVAWFTENAGDYAPLGLNDPNYGTHQAGTKLPNEHGIYNMCGNVLEACWDIHFTGNGRTLRGGSYNSMSYQCSINYPWYYWHPIWGGGDSIGFRVVRNP
jgi:formylglycine-generating enzyme